MPQTRRQLTARRSSRDAGLGKVGFSSQGHCFPADASLGKLFRLLLHLQLDSWKSRCLQVFPRSAGKQLDGSPRNREFLTQMVLRVPLRSWRSSSPGEDLSPQLGDSHSWNWGKWLHSQRTFCWHCWGGDSSPHACPLTRTRPGNRYTAETKFTLFSREKLILYVSPVGFLTWWPNKLTGSSRYHFSK